MHFEETAEYVTRSRGREDEGRRLHRLFDLAWDYTLHEFPEFATYVGRSEYNHLWSDHALEAYERRNREMEVPARVLATIERDRLSGADRVHHDLFKRVVEENLEGRRFKDADWPPHHPTAEASGLPQVRRTQAD
jgi:uncharacterized protein (DUF885 family)